MDTSAVWVDARQKRTARVSDTQTHTSSQVAVSFIAVKVVLSYERERFLAIPIPNNSNTHTSFGAWSPVHARARRADRVAR